MTETERAQQISSGPRRRFMQNIVMLAALIIALASLLLTVYQSQTRAETAESSALSLAQQVQQACESQGSLDLDGRDLCAQADEVVEDPTTVTPPAPGRDGDRGPGPTQAQILSAFDVWCDLRSCHGSDGDDGDDAPPMTQEQIFAGFATWCSTDPRCVGEPGRDGADSTIPGPSGRPPTAQEVLAAVEVVCADGACDGEDGTDGAAGANGKDGRSIVKTECHTTGDWIITYSDGTAETTTGPCRVVTPTPEPTPTPMRR